MHRYKKAALSLLGFLLLGWVAVKFVYEPFMTRQVIALMAEESRKIEVFNDVGGSRHTIPWALFFRKVVFAKRRISSRFSRVSS